MFRFGLAAAFAATAALPLAAHAQSEQQALVDRSTLAAQDMFNDRDGTQAASVLRQARAVMICPQVIKAGFMFAGQGGDCVLTARDGNGTWSYPAFYTLGSGSFGFQIGLQDSEIAFLIMTNRGLRAILDDQLKLGADAGATFVQWGGGVEGATTAAAGADIVGFTRSRGLYAGIALSGSILASKSAYNRAYYGREEAAQQIVISMEASNPGADPLRQTLTRYGSAGAAAPAYPAAQAQPGYGAPGYAAQPGYAQQPGYAAQPGYAPQQAYAAPPSSYAPIRGQSLPPPPARPGY